MNRTTTAGLLMTVLVAACGGDDAFSSTTVAAVQITAPLATLRPGQTSPFSAVAVNGQGRAISGAGTVTWSSLTPDVATIDANGLVTALVEGSTSITATVQGVQGTRVVTVIPVGAGAVVTMPGNSFIPFEVTIRVTEQVYFEFPQELHNVIFGAKAGAPQDIPQVRNRTISRAFNVAGQFAYDCTLHPGMTGLVVVTP